MADFAIIKIQHFTFRCVPGGADAEFPGVDASGSRLLAGPKSCDHEPEDPQATSL